MNFRNPLSVLLMAACSLVGCATVDYSSVKSLGEPTPIKAGQSPMDVLCEIRAEFMALPKPVLRHIAHHRDTRRSIITQSGLEATERLPAYYEFRLTETARQWANSHTQTEISAALTSLVPDPEVGGEAAVMLTSLATTRKFRSDQYGYHPAKISNQLSYWMHETGYRSPSKRGVWDLKTALSFKLPKHEANAYLYDRGARPQLTPKVSENTLIYHLREMRSDLSYYENGILAKGIYGYDSFTNVDTLDEWHSINLLPPMPEPTIHRKLLDTYGVDFLVVGSAGWELPNRWELPNGWGFPRGFAIYELGLEKYWPIAYGYEHTIERYYSKYRNEFERAVKQRVYEMAKAVCEPPSDR